MQNKSLTGIQIPNKTKQIKISRYADDSNLFLKNLFAFLLSRYNKLTTTKTTKKKAETKVIYKKLIQEGSKQHAIAGETQWKKQLPTTDFRQIWKNIFEPYAQQFYKDLHYRLLHHSTKTSDYMHKCSNDNNSNCDHCRLTEDNLHLFTKCSRIEKIWTHYQPILTKLIGKTYILQQHLLTLNVKNINKDTRNLTLTMIQIILFEIWQSRNNNKYDKNLLPQYTIISEINAQLKNIVQAHYKKQKSNDTFNQLKNQFCSNEAKP